MDRIEIHANKVPYDRRIDLYFIQGNKFISGVKFSEIEPGSEINKAVQIDVDTAQSLMNQLYNIGIRPTGIEQSIAALPATKNHLEDMRKIAFMFLEKDK